MHSHCLLAGFLGTCKIHTHSHLLENWSISSCSNQRAYGDEKICLSQWVVPPGTKNKDVRKYLFGSSPLHPLISLCIFVRTLKKSASRFCIASADTTDRTPGRVTIQEMRI